MRIAVIGKGRVGSVIAPRWAEAGHEVVFGVRDPGDAKYGGGNVALKTVSEAAAFAEVIALPVMWDGIDAVLADMGDVAGKILIDTTNPLDIFGGVKSLIDGNGSAGEMIQAKTHGVVVKTLNQSSSVLMDIAKTLPERPIQFVAADDDAAKAMVMKLVEDLGFRGVDAGPLSYSRELEAMGKLLISQMFMHAMPPTTGWYLK